MLSDAGSIPAASTSLRFSNRDRFEKLRLGKPVTRRTRFVMVSQRRRPKGEDCPGVVDNEAGLHHRLRLGKPG